MKKVLQFSLIILALLMCFDTDLYGQRRGKKKKKKPAKTTETDDYFDESGGFKHRLWYGGSFNLGFTGNNGTSQFNIGVAPMVGYKIFDKLSAGPRASLDYTFVKINCGNEAKNAQLTSYSIGAFARYKVFNNIFLHTEYELENEGGVLFSCVADNEKFREIKDNYYIGAGYNSGGQLGYEVYLLYNVLEPETSFNLPFSFRFGLTYGF